MHHLPRASFALPWDDPDAPDPVPALASARAELGDSFRVDSGDTPYVFVFAAPALRAFYALDERDASKALADFRMLRRKLPDELFLTRRTFAHDLFGRDDVETYLDHFDAALLAQIAELGPAGTFDAFGFARRVGHRLGLACWLGREADLDALVADLDTLDGAQAFVAPRAMVGRDFADERAALARVELAVGEMLARADRAPSFLDVIAARWADVAPGEERVRGIAGDVVLLHIATMTNLFAAIGWSLALAALHPDVVAREPLDAIALEAVRLGQRSIMLREVMRPLEFDDGSRVVELERGTQLATMLPLTNLAGAEGVRYDPARWHDRALQRDPSVTTFGHGSHRCPAQRFSIAAIGRTVRALLDRYELVPAFGAVEPEPAQIGGVARAGAPCPVRYTSR